VRSPARLLPRLTARLERAGGGSASTEAGLLIEAASGRPRLLLPADTTPLEQAQLDLLETWVRRREAREPLQLILGSTEFHGLTLRVDRGVLIPRPETELLTELALERLAGLEAPLVLDVGCGSGAIGLAIRHARPDARVCGTDIAPDALRLAARNARELGLELELFEADLLDSSAVRELARQADLLVSNPPYLPEADLHAVSPEVRAEPGLALYAGPDGLAVYRKLLGQAGQLLKPGAVIALELDPRNVHEAASAAAAAGWGRPEVVADLTGKARFLFLEKT